MAGSTESPVQPGAILSGLFVDESILYGRVGIRAVGKTPNIHRAVRTQPLDQAAQRNLGQIPRQLCQYDTRPPGGTVGDFDRERTRPTRSNGRDKADQPNTAYCVHPLDPFTVPPSTGVHAARGTVL